MNLKAILLVLSLQIMIIMSFDCSDIIIEAQCDPFLTEFACAWDTDQGKCLGNFSTSCPSQNCYYVDPASQTDSSDGSFKNPFTSIEQALEASATSDEVEIILINNAYDKIFQLKKQYQIHQLSLSIMIR